MTTYIQKGNAGGYKAKDKKRTRGFEKAVNAGAALKRQTPNKSK
tara:strand:+ start:307 stop:438 length:132 start_codon:yes stop_codon:yes gene_type:complete